MTENTDVTLGELRDYVKRWEEGCREVHEHLDRVRKMQQIIVRNSDEVELETKEIQGTYVEIIIHAKEMSPDEAVDVAEVDIWDQAKLSRGESSRDGFDLYAKVGLKVL